MSPPQPLTCWNAFVHAGRYTPDSGNSDHLHLLSVYVDGLRDHLVMTICAFFILQCLVPSHIIIHK